MFPKIDEYVKKTIEEKAKAILEKMKGGTLFGCPADLSDINFVVVAAYLIGKAEGRL